MYDSRPGAALTVVGGFGAPYDTLAAAALSHLGKTCALGALDRGALAEGRAALPRGQCAPLCATTGALERVLQAHPTQSVTFVGASSCGPCRYALFAPAWRRSLSHYTKLRVLDFEQSFVGVTEVFGEAACQRLLDAIVVADALLQAERALRPYVAEPQRLDACCADALTAIVERIRRGESALCALRAQRRFFEDLELRSPEAMGRAVLIGDPWSVHADGDPQCQVSRLLGDAGVEVEVPPLALWLAYRLWERTQPWGARAPLNSEQLERCRSQQREIALRYEEACRALGMQSTLPSIEGLAELAQPHLPASFRGGYGHVEVALAVRARAQRRGHVVISVKSFGCMPSSGVSDAIVPSVLGDALGFLAVEVCEDGVAARESRLMLQIAAARDRAQAELAAVYERYRLDPARVQRDLPRIDPLRAMQPEATREYACTLACEVAQRAEQGASAP